MACGPDSLLGQQSRACMPCIQYSRFTYSRATLRSIYSALVDLKLTHEEKWNECRARPVRTKRQQCRRERAQARKGKSTPTNGKCNLFHAHFKTATVEGAKGAGTRYEKMRGNSNRNNQQWTKWARFQPSAGLDLTETWRCERKRPTTIAFMFGAEVQCQIWRCIHPIVQRCSSVTGGSDRKKRLHSNRWHVHDVECGRPLYLCILGSVEKFRSSKHWIEWHRSDHCSSIPTSLCRRRCNFNLSRAVCGSRKGQI